MKTSHKIILVIALIALAVMVQKNRAAIERYMPYAVFREKAKDGSRR